MHDAKPRPRERTPDRPRSPAWTRRRSAERRLPLSTTLRTPAPLGPYEVRYDVREGYAEHQRLRPI